jgi:Peptidase family M1 domain
MLRLFLAFLLSDILASHASAQVAPASKGVQLYVPRDVQLAYRHGTRSPDGRPGPNYWQNHGRYEITINAAPPDRTIRGTEKITYFNNSPDTLKVIDFRLIVNIHKPGITRLGNEDSTYLNPGVHIDSYSENGQEHRWRNQDHDGTWKFIRLLTPLLPHDSLRLDITWHYLASLKSNREGMIDSTTYFLAYSYPRVAVYDDYSGWDRMDFTDAQEFYNDFNDYVLHVNVPKNFVVWATGDLQNPNDVLQPAYARKLAASYTSDDITRIASPAEIAGGKVTTQNAINSWTWKAGNITDMAFGLSDHFAWDASSVVVDDATGRRASVQSAYNDTAKDYHHMVEFGRHALDWLSHNWPGVAYPFPKTTVFQGYAGMEYPMMANDETYEDPNFARFVAEHEIAHSYFPFYMGINESRYGFMDEGWATTFEYLIGNADLGKDKADEFYREFRVNYFTYDPSPLEDLPIITPADALKGVPYGTNAYGKPSLAYLAMKDMLGDELFKKCLQTYMDRWHGKHPIPWDFFYSFNDASGKDLNWFWNNWFFTNNYLDLAVTSGSQMRMIDNHTSITVNIHNVGGFAIPFDVVLHYTDGSSKSIHETPAVWEKDQQNIIIIVPTDAGRTLASLELNTGIYVDANPADNKWPAK